MVLFRDDDGCEGYDVILTQRQGSLGRGKPVTSLRPCDL